MYMEPIKDAGGGGESKILFPATSAGINTDCIPITVIFNICTVLICLNDPNFPLPPSGMFVFRTVIYQH